MENKNKVKVLKFAASWCGPCRVLKTTLNGFKECEMVEVDVDNDPEALAPKYGVRAVPTLVIVNSETGEELWRKSGVIAKIELDQAVKTFNK
jgi:thioredoxin 1